MSVLWVQLIAMFSVLISVTILPVTLADRRKRREITAHNAKFDAMEAPYRLQREAGEMARHAIEYDLPTMPWYGLAAFWGRITGDEPEIIDITAEPEPEPEPEQPRVVDAAESDFDLEAFVARTARRVKQAEDEALQEVSEIERRYHDPEMQRQAELHRAEKALARARRSPAGQARGLAAQRNRRGRLRARSAT